MDLKHEMIWLMALVGAAAFVCYVILTIQFFRKGATSIGLLCAICPFLFGCGLVVSVPVSLIIGWSRRRQLGVSSLMIVYSILVIVVMVLFLIALALAQLFPGIGRSRF
jgi:hypothetical protein